VAPRHVVLEELSDALAAVHAPDRLTRIGIDGVDGAGKTSLAEEIAQLLTKRARPCVRVSLDFFEQPPAERYARGELSAEGYYLDAFDVERLRAHVLSLDGPREVVVVVDGIFLQRPELADLWDATVWVEADLGAAAERALQRDRVRIDSVEAELERYRLRYLPAQRRYMEEERPHERATFVLRNTELDEPELVRQPRPR
jgi:uridine kinase